MHNRGRWRWTFILPCSLVEALGQDLFELEGSLLLLHEGFPRIVLPLGMHVRMRTQKRILAMAVAALLAGQAHALPLEAIGTFLTKLFKGGAAKEAVNASRASEGVSVGKGFEHHAAGDAAKTRPVLADSEPKPNLIADIVAKSQTDAETYKVLRAAAGKGDPAAMLKMYEMTSSGKVTDPGEPWRGYWMFQAARLGSQAASQKSRDECVASASRRKTDKLFDSACGSVEGFNLYNQEK